MPVIVIIYSMSKKLSCHSNKTVLLEDPNAATAR